MKYTQQIVFKSNISLWIIPENVYKIMRVSLAELAVNVKPYREIGACLIQKMSDFNFVTVLISHRHQGEVWYSGNSPIVSLLLDEHQYGWVMKPAPRETSDMRYVHYQKERMVRWYHFVDSAFTLQDMYAKLKLHYG
ncbi:hypothetical protein KHA96_06945 [Bacillus sp. FJAT-49711]|uniref:hypothetical protein n=1 Tax=Bacillus sp. FJAT-49711 TaxID=2833585 RepID=UPI001BC961E3|nr:hypothetical protein [Bacillus sp. FJAT-49711]MBS4218060.1 hypothetical protein [Bacillus sp. FJAT-49711]